MIGSSSPTKTLWNIAIDERKYVLENTATDLSKISCESQLLICGSKDAGKSSLSQRLLERDELPKPTVGLDFCYGRKSKQNNMTSVKDVTEIWELSGGTTMTNLIDSIITAASIKTLSVVLVLDLSKPNELWETQEIILNQIKNRISKVIAEKSKTDSGLEKTLKDKALERIGENHSDKNMISPLLVPFLIIGSKFDLLQELSADKRQMISKTIRLLAHINGGMIQYFSTKAEGLSARAKAVLNHLAFNTPLSKSSSFDHNKPLIVPFGADSLEQIGAPPVSSDQLMRSRGGSPYDLWKDAYSSVFPPSKTQTDDKKNPALDKQFADELIDNLRVQKDEELDRYRKLSERKAKEAKLNATVGKQKKK